MTDLLMLELDIILVSNALYHEVGHLLAMLLRDYSRVVWIVNIVCMLSIRQYHAAISRSSISGPPGLELERMRE